MLHLSDALGFENVPYKRCDENSIKAFDLNKANATNVLNYGYCPNDEYLNQKGLIRGGIDRRWNKNFIINVKRCQ